MNEDLNNINGQATPVMDNPLQGNQELPPVTPQVDVAPQATPQIEEVPQVTVVEETPVIPVVETPIQPVVNNLEDTIAIPAIQEELTPQVVLNEEKVETNVTINGLQPETPTVEPVNPTPQVEPQTQTPTEQLEPNKKKTPVVLIVVIAILAVLAGAFFLFKDKLFGEAYKLVSQKSTTYLKNVVNEVSDAIDFTKPLLGSGDLSITSDIEGLDFISDYKIGYKFGLDTKNNQALIGLNINEKEKQIIGLDAVNKDDKLYIKAPEFFSNIYYISSELNLSELVENNTNSDDSEYLLNTIEKAINESLKEGYETSKETININGKEVKVTDTYYELDENAYSKLLSRGIDTIKNDSKAVKILADMTGLTEDEMKESLESSKKADFEGTIRFDIYTKGLIKELVGFKLNDGTSVLEYTADDNYSNFVITEDETKITVETKNDNTDVKIVDGEESYSGKITKVSNEEYKYDFNILGYKINGNIKSKKEGKTETCNLVLNIDLAEAGKVTINSNSKVETDAKLEFFDTSKALDFDKMTDADSEKMLTKLSELMENSGLSSMLGGLLAE